MSARGEVKVELVSGYGGRLYVSARIPHWLVRKAATLQLASPLNAAIDRASDALFLARSSHSPPEQPMARARAWIAVADAIAQAVALEATDVEIGEG